MEQLIAQMLKKKDPGKEENKKWNAVWCEKIQYKDWEKWLYLQGINDL